MNLSSISEFPLTAPKAHELEVVIFGPGVGECILMHLGDSDWFVIDSCKFPGNHSPAAIEYLESISVEPSSSIKRILATHWHDDHVRGIGDLLRRCPNARFAMSGALAGDQFFQLVFEVETQNTLVSGSSTATEFADILEQLRSRGQSIVAPDFYAQDAMVLFEGGYQRGAVVQALSPSAATITSASMKLASELLTTGKTRCFKRLEPNDFSVAAQVSVGPVVLLLGADLENTDDPAFGWKAVLASPSRPRRSGSFFKVAHHGSENANHDDVWLTMLDRNPLSVVTPFARQEKPLPTHNDVTRMKLKTDRLYVTTWPPSSRPPRRSGVDGIVASATRVRKAVSRKRGFVRIRFDLTKSAPQAVVDLFGSASRL